MESVSVSVSVMWDYYVNNMSNNCFPSSKALWFQLAVGFLALHSLVRLFLFIGRFFRFTLLSQSPSPSPSPSPSTIKRRRQRKKRRASSNKTDIAPPRLLAEDTKEEEEPKPLPTLRKFTPLHSLFRLFNTVVLAEDTEEEEPKPLPTLRKFTHQYLADATQNFKSEGCIGFDYMGSIFVAKMVDTDEVFAMKEIWVNLFPDKAEFVAHTLHLARANHPNIARVIGYSTDGREKVLVYEPVGAGTLEHFLHGEDGKCLDWKVRMKIALGVSMALEYLQNTMKPPILHLYLQPCNIWLDEEYTPKLSCYGLVGVYSPGNTVFSWRISMMGMNFYADHDFKLTKDITLQTDIYGFGLLLLKIITGIYRDGWTKSQMKWVEPYLKDKEKAGEMVDPKLGGAFKNEELHEVCEIAEMCLRTQPGSRPLIRDLVKRMNRLV